MPSGSVRDGRAEIARKIMPRKGRAFVNKKSGIGQMPDATLQIMMILRFVYS